MPSLHRTRQSSNQHPRSLMRSNQPMEPTLLTTTSTNKGGGHGCRYPQDRSTVHGMAVPLISLVVLLYYFFEVSP